VPARDYHAIKWAGLHIDQNVAHKKNARIEMRALAVLRRFRSGSGAGW